MARFKTINDICNQVALETGLPKTQDVFTTADASYEQLIALANACGYELLQLNTWEQLVRPHSIVTASTDNGIYPLPDDYAYMLDQTGWEKTNAEPITSPLSAQEWTYLSGRGLVTETIRISMRLQKGMIYVFPYANGTPTPDGLDITFEYISRGWIWEAGNDTIYVDRLTTASDTVLFEPYMFERLLKARFLEARGFDSTKANEQFELAFMSWVGKDEGARIINAGGRHSYPYLNPFCNTQDTGFGH